MKSYSQSKQDLFALLVNSNRKGFFIDVGCSSPDWQSNSRLLVENGWKGIGVDNVDWGAAWARLNAVELGEATFLCLNALDVSWTSLRANKAIPEGLIDYLSLDVDFGTFDALKSLIGQGVEFRCATIEHDSYRFGPAMRDCQRELMNLTGYVRLIDDVKHNGFAYEDWYVNRSVSGIDEIRETVLGWQRQPEIVR